MSPVWADTGPAGAHLELEGVSRGFFYSPPPPLWVLQGWLLRKLLVTREVEPEVAFGEWTRGLALVACCPP